MQQEQPRSEGFFRVKGAADRAETAWKSGGEEGRLAENRVFRPDGNGRRVKQLRDGDRRPGRLPGNLGTAIIERSPRTLLR